MKNTETRYKCQGCVFKSGCFILCIDSIQFQGQTTNRKKISNAPSVKTSEFGSQKLQKNLFFSFLNNVQGREKTITIGKKFTRLYRQYLKSLCNLWKCYNRTCGLVRSRQSN